MIVVFDTNVWISALQFAKQYGTPTQALERAMRQDTIATAFEIEDEIHRVLTRKFSWESDRVQDAMRLILARSIHVRLRGSVAVCRDPNDNMFLECAVRSHADLIVAGDKDLLVLESYEGTRIVTPAAYVSWEKHREA